MKKILALFLLLSLLFVADICYADGSNVKVVLKDGDQLQGELLFVDQSSVVISTIESATDQVLESAEDAVLIIPTKSITNITVLGQSKILLHTGVGLLIGAAVGAGIAFGGENRNYALLPGILFGGIGLILGFIDGIVSSTGDKVFEMGDKDDYSFSNNYARYKECPAFLKVKLIGVQK